MAARKAPAKKAPAKKAPAKKKAVAKKAPAKKAPAKKKAAAKKAPAKKKAAAKKAPARKARQEEGSSQEGSGQEEGPAKKAPAKKAPAKKKAAKKKAPAKKAPPRRRQQPRRLRPRRPRQEEGSSQEGSGQEGSRQEEGSSQEGSRQEEGSSQEGSRQEEGSSQEGPRQALSSGSTNLNDGARSRPRPVVASGPRRVQRSLISLKTSAAPTPMGRSELGQTTPNPISECRQLGVVDGLHGRLELAFVCIQGGQLRVDPIGDVLEVVGNIGLEQQQVLRAMVSDTVFREVVRIAGGDDAITREQAGVAMVGVQAVALPRVVAEHDIRAELDGSPGQLGCGR